MRAESARPLDALQLPATLKQAFPPLIPTCALAAISAVNCAHGALFNAVTASDAGLFVYNLAYAVYNLDAFLGASVDANSAANALIINDYWMRHENLFSLGLLEMLCHTWGQFFFG